MANHFRIRPATPADVPAILAVERAVFSDPWTTEQFADLTADLTLVGLEDGQLRGYVVARQVADEAEILNLAVEPERRRAGVGSALMGAALARLAENGVRTVHLEVRASNAEAFGFYARWGFSEVGRRRAYYRRPVEDARLLTLRLDPESGPA